MFVTGNANAGIRDSHQKLWGWCPSPDHRTWHLERIGEDSEEKGHLILNDLIYSSILIKSLTLLYFWGTNYILARNLFPIMWFSCFSFPIYNCSISTPPCSHTLMWEKRYWFSWIHGKRPLRGLEADIPSTSLHTMNWRCILLLHSYSFHYSLF